MTETTRAEPEPTTVMNGVPIGRIRGIPIRVNWSVAVIATLLSWSLADSVFPTLVEGRSAGDYWTTGVVTTIAFLISLAAHEYGHALVALRENVRVTAITLWIFGGVAQLGDAPNDPGAALRIAAAGPAVSAAIGVVSITVSAGLDGLPQAATLWLGAMNLVLMGFNLLPAFPLDGGRIYQAWLWRRSGDPVAATNRAARAGLTIGAVLVGLGVVQVLAGGLIGGLWSMAIGWFVREAARAEATAAITDAPLQRMTVAEIMSPDPVTVDAATPISVFVDGLVRSGRHSAYPVTDDGRVVGAIALTDVRRAGDRDLADATVRDFAMPIERIPVVRPDATVADLARTVGERRGTRTLVMDGDRLVGIVASSDLSRLLIVLELQASHPA